MQLLYIRLIIRFLELSFYDCCHNCFFYYSPLHISSLTHFYYFTNDFKKLRNYLVCSSLFRDTLYLTVFYHLTSLKIYQVVKLKQISDSSGLCVFLKKLHCIILSVACMDIRLHTCMLFLAKFRLLS